MSTPIIISIASFSDIIRLSKYFSLIVGLFFSVSTSAQDFPKVGTFWNYSYQSSPEGCPLGVCEYGSSTIRVVSQSTANGETTSVLLRTDLYNAYMMGSGRRKYQLGSLIKRNDSIFYSLYNPSTSSPEDPRFLFSFNMQVDDTIETHPELHIAVDSIKNELIDGTTKKVFYVSRFTNISSSDISVHRIIEDIGPVDDFLTYDMINAEYGTTHYFECFSDGELTFGVSPCIASTEEKVEDESFILFPNPVADYLQLEGTGLSVALIEIYNEEGNKINSIIPDKKNILVDFRTYSPGMYLVKITDQKGAYATKQIVKK